MGKHKVEKELGYAAISLEGASSSVAEAAKSYAAAGFIVAAVNFNSLLLQNVLSSQLEGMNEIASEHALRVGNVVGEKILARSIPVQKKKAFKLHIRPNMWYFAEQMENDFPFVFVRDVRIEKHGDVEDQVLELELYGTGNAMPIPQTINSREAAQYGMRPATEEDFDRMDMITPQPLRLVLPTEDGAPKAHGIPDDSMAVQNTHPNPLMPMHRS